jgi:hypothetical protein
MAFNYLIYQYLHFLSFANKKILPQFALKNQQIMQPQQDIVSPCNNMVVAISENVFYDQIVLNLWLQFFSDVSQMNI